MCMCMCMCMCIYICMCACVKHYLPGPAISVLRNSVAFLINL